MNIKNILVIRRDNIGDLVCTTPLFESLRKIYPDANIYAYVNTLNAPVLAGNPYINQVFTYTKAKHRAKGQSRISLYWQRFKTLMQLKKLNIDTVILANPQPCKQSLKIAKTLGVSRIIGAEIQGESAISHPYRPQDFYGKHQVEHVYSYLYALTEQVPAIPPVRVFVQSELLRQVKQQLPVNIEGTRVIGIHISVRRPQNRWSMENYAQLIRMIAEEQEQPTKFMLFWAPERAEDIHDKGDSEKASYLLSLCSGLPIIPLPTATVEMLKTGFSLCDAIICSEGGPMHLAAALDKKLMVFFANPSIDHWRPWCQNNQLLIPNDGDCKSISPQQAFDTFSKLCSYG
jgi:ADP-heptose:LPS heptosyltransferase